MDQANMLFDERERSRHGRCSRLKITPPLTGQAMGMGLVSPSNVSAWRYGPTFRAGQYQESTSLAAFTGSWSTHKTASALGGAVKVGYSPAASARFHATAYDFGLVVTKSTTGGQADIYVDGVLAGRISLHATRTTYRQLVFARHFATLASHTIEVRPVGNGRVDVDALTVLR